MHSIYLGPKGSHTAMQLHGPPTLYSPKNLANVGLKAHILLYLGGLGKAWGSGFRVLGLASIVGSRASESSKVLTVKDSGHPLALEIYDFLPKQLYIEHT